MFIFKCGSCGSLHRISESSIHSRKFGRNCMNCGAYIPSDIILQAYGLENSKNTAENENWEIYRIPDEAKVSLDVTLPQE